MEVDSKAKSEDTSDPSYVSPDKKLMKHINLLKKLIQRYQKGIQKFSQLKDRAKGLISQCEGLLANEDIIELFTLFDKYLKSVNENEITNMASSMA